jgi:UDP-N-acetyl-D-galactosamine dehydrogenase
VNELAIIFREMNIDTLDVLEAAGSKLNFLPFRPGLVGGHCIGVDPYYLTHKSEQLGYLPQVMLAGRRINDSMGRWLAEQLLFGLAERRQELVGTRVLVLCLSFKENCPDLRNTKVVDLIRGLERYGMAVQVVDLWVDPQVARREYGLEVMLWIPACARYGAVVAAVGHRQFTELCAEQWQQLLTPGGVLLDLKGIVPKYLGAMRL